jgi:dipeptidyl aminopeptidase/acylaminoacyl peptidase
VTISGDIPTSETLASDKQTSETRVKDAQTSDSTAVLMARLLEEEDEESRQMKRGDWVDDADATINDKDDEEKEKDEEKQDEAKGPDGKKKEPAPRYSGIEAFVWSETAPELLFVSEGDVYRFAVGDEKPTRLTRTGEPERSVQWWPDDSGFLCRQGSALRRVTFDRFAVEELRAKLGDGDELAGYKISPDGHWLALMAYKTNPPPAPPDQKYAIAKYRDRRMEPERISRTVLDDPLPEREFAIFLLEIGKTFQEESETTEVFRFKTKAPGATISQPDWAPDSTRIVFSCWDQESEQIALYEALTRPEEQKPRKGEKKKEKGDTEETRKEDRKDEKDSEKETEEKEDRTDRSDQSDKPKDPENSGGKKDDGKPKPEKARKIYSFMHTGGPNTPEMIEPQYLADSRRIVFLSEITGFRHLQILDPLYEGLSPLTHGYFEVYPLALSKDHKWVFILSTQDHPGRQSLYKVSTDDGTLVRLSPELGYYEEAAVSPQGDYALSNFSTFGKLRELVAINTAQSTQTALTDSHPPIARVHTRAVPEFITYKNRHGHDIHGQMFRPDGWDKNEKWPLLVYVYGGPLGIRKMVTDGAYDQASYFFALYMAKKHGYVTVTIDPRGVSGYGGVFEKANYERVGRPQVEDLVDGVDYLVENYGVDRKRVGIHGWSFAASRRRCASTPSRTSSPQARRAPDPPNGKTTTPGTRATRWATAARANRT